VCGYQLENEQFDIGSSSYIEGRTSTVYIFGLVCEQWSGGGGGSATSPFFVVLGGASSVLLQQLGQERERKRGTVALGRRRLGLLVIRRRLRSVDTEGLVIILVLLLRRVPVAIDRTG